jgi:hypothetical protein
LSPIAKHVIARIIKFGVCAVGRLCGGRRVSGLMFVKQASVPPFGQTRFVARMGLLDGLLHLLNFITPGVGVGALTSAMVWLIWRRHWAACTPPRRFLPLLLSACVAGVAALVLGLLLFGQDGKMNSYFLLMLSVALALWLMGLRHLPLEALPPAPPISPPEH